VEAIAAIRFETTTDELKWYERAKIAISRNNEKLPTEAHLNKVGVRNSLTLLFSFNLIPSFG